MTPEVILNTFAVIGAIVGFIALHSSFLLAKTKSNLVTWIYPIAVVVAMVFVVDGVIKIQGYPVNGRPDVEFEYVSHTMEGSEAVVLTRIDSEIRVYRWVPTQEEQEQLEKGEEGTANGQSFSMFMHEGDLPQVELVRLEERAPKEGY